MEDRIYIIGGGGSGSSSILSSTYIGEGGNRKSKGMLYLFNYDKQRKIPIIVDSDYNIDGITKKLKDNTNHDNVGFIDLADR